MDPSQENSVAPAIVLLAIVCFGASVEFFAEKAWRTRLQRGAATATYLGNLLLFTGMVMREVDPLYALLCCVLLCQGLKRLWTLTETRAATVKGAHGTSVLLETDDGSMVAVSPHAGGHSFDRGDIVRVRISSSYLFGWRLWAEIA